MVYNYTIVCKYLSTIPISKGSVFCFSGLGDAIRPEVDLVIEAIAEDLDAKQILMEGEARRVKL